MSGLLMKKCCCVKPCSFCTGATPKSWTVSFTGVDTNAPCSFCGLSPNRNFQGSGDALGTYTIPQGTDPAFPCRYVKITTGGPRLFSHTRTGGGDTSCTVDATIDDLFLQLDMGAVTTGLGASWNPADPTHSYWFSGGFSLGTGAGDHDCTAPVTINNGLTFYNCEFYGINGSAICTPNF